MPIRMCANKGYVSTLPVASGVSVLACTDVCAPFYVLFIQPGVEPLLCFTVVSALC